MKQSRFEKKPTLNDEALKVTLYCLGHLSFETNCSGFSSGDLFYNFWSKYLKNISNQEIFSAQLIKERLRGQNLLTKTYTNYT